MTITIQSLVTAAALAAAVAALLGYYNRGFVWFRRQQSQDEDIRAIKAEQGLLTYGVLACLKGLKEQGCNGPVTEAIQIIERHLNDAAHQ